MPASSPPITPTMRETVLPSLGFWILIGGVFFGLLVLYLCVILAFNWTFNLSPTPPWPAPSSLTDADCTPFICPSQYVHVKYAQRYSWPPRRVLSRLDAYCRLGSVTSHN